jgi:histone arginine demethylase JMJD6
MKSLRTENRVGGIGESLVSVAMPREIRIDHRDNLSYDEFATEYLYANKPVIVTDAMREWKALTRWSPEFFQKEFGAMKFALPDAKPKSEHPPGGDAEYSMAGFIDLILNSTDENPAPYLRNVVLYEQFPSLRDDIEPLPEYLEPNWLPDHYFLKSVGQILNRGAAIEIYIGGKGGAFPVLHYDGAAAHAFLMHIYGRKRFILYPPEQTPFLYPSREKPNISMLNSLDAPDLQRFPLFEKAVATTFILEAGELLFIPSGWWHTTKMLTPCISISANVVNQSNWKALIDYAAKRVHNPLKSFAGRIYLTAAGARRSWRDRAWHQRTQAKTDRERPGSR